MTIIPKLPKLGSRGAAHIIAPLLTVVGVAVVGTGILVASHAGSPTPPIAYMTTAGSTNTLLKESANTIDPATGTLKVLASASGSQSVVAQPTYSPDHKYLTWSSNIGAQYYITIQTVATGAKKTVALPANVSVYNNTLLSWFPQSTKFTFTSSDYNPTTQVTNYTVRTMNADGTGLAVLTSSTTSQPSSLAPSGDGNSVVYATFGTNSHTADGIYSIAPGGKPVKLHLGNCSTVRTLGGGVTAAVYQCTNNTFTATNIYKSVPGTANNATLLHSFADNATTAGGVWYSIKDITPTANGQKLALLMEKAKEADPAQCTYYDQLQVSTLPVKAKAAVTNVYSGPQSGPGGGCYGGGSWDQYQVQWSPDSSSIAYLQWTPFNQPAGTSLNLLTLSTRTVKQLVASPVNNISW